MSAVNESNRSFYYCIMICCLLLFSCKQNKRKQDIRQVVVEWTGKAIQFPTGIPCKSLGRDTDCVDTSNPNYKILLYVDSAGCTGCRLKLSEWKQLISEADALFPGKMDFLFFYQPKQRDLRELALQMNMADFPYPVFLDMDNQIDRANRFPSDPSFQCFLLDRDNKVVLIGNPAVNPQIWELYKEQISGARRTANPVTTVQVSPERQELNGMKPGETYSCVFEIENTGSYPFVILGVHSSCGCAVPVWDKQPIAPGGKTEIRVEVKPDETGFFNKTIDVYGNIAQSVLKLSMIGTVE